MFENQCIMTVMKNLLKKVAEKFVGNEKSG